MPLIYYVCIFQLISLCFLNRIIYVNYILLFKIVELKSIIFSPLTFSKLFISYKIS